MNESRLFAVVVGIGVALLALSSLFVVRQHELAIKFEFGEVVRADYEPGLHFRVPFMHTVRKFDQRVLTFISRPEQFLTNEQKSVTVDFFVKWRIADVANYYRATSGGDETIAASRLQEIVRAGLKNEINKRNLQDLVSAERTEVMGVITRDANALVATLGVELVDVRLMQIEFPDQAVGSVYARMRSERQQVATKLRAEGGEQAEKLRAQADRESTVLVAEAYREAEKLKGEGDGQAAAIYARAYGRDAEFFAFYRSLEAYRRGFGDGRSVLVLDPDSEFFRYFGSGRVRR
jgi:membrane protease subunit HflC